jgi:putative PIG3 family NAD(P)H quinone oxidoreductase
MMTAIGIAKPGGPEMLQPVILPRPEPGPGEILIRVRAAGINRPDVAQRQGRYPPPEGAPDTPGLEVAGEVAALGPGARRYKPGDTVMALVPGGGYAEYCLAAESCALPLPSALTVIEGAALPETFFTVWTNVFARAALKPGEAFLVHGGTSGIGTTAIMLAKAFGATVYTTAGSEEKCAAARALGADRAINYRQEDFVGAVKAATAGRGVDVVLDMVGGDYVARNLKCLAPDGRHVSIAFLNGPKAELFIPDIMTKRLTLTGSTLRPRSVTEKGAIAAALEAQILPLIAAGRIKPVIDRTYPLRQAAEAHRRMESSAHIGKIVLTVT